VLLLIGGKGFNSPKLVLLVGIIFLLLVMVFLLLSLLFLLGARGGSRTIRVMVLLILLLVPFVGLLRAGGIDRQRHQSSK
jgi:hypothetical protein